MLSSRRAHPSMQLGRQPGRWDLDVCSTGGATFRPRWRTGLLDGCLVPQSNRLSAEHAQEICGLVGIPAKQYVWRLVRFTFKVAACCSGAAGRSAGLILMSYTQLGACERAHQHTITWNRNGRSQSPGGKARDLAMRGLVLLQARQYTVRGTFSGTE